MRRSQKDPRGKRLVIEAENEKRLESQYHL